MCSRGVPLSLTFCGLACGGQLLAVLQKGMRRLTASFCSVLSQFACRRSRIGDIFCRRCAMYFCIHSFLGDYPPYRDLKGLCALAGRLVNKCICPQAPPGSLSSLALLATSSRSLPFRAVADMFASWTPCVLYVFCSEYVSLAYSICSLLVAS